MWVARDFDDTLYLYKNKPVKDVESGIWKVEIGLDYYELSDAEYWMFENVKWEDDEPTEIKLIRK